MRRRAVSVGIVCAVLVGLLGPAVPQALAEARVAPIQRGLLDKLRAGSLDSFVVEFAARADLHAAAATKGWAARGRAVHQTLTRVAARAQAGARAVVHATAGARAETFWLTNVLVVTDGATPALARRLAGLAGVKSIRAARTFPLVEPVERHSVRITEDEPPPWGVTKIGAEDVWAEGVLGSGVVVANIDTGVDYTHEALVEQYRGNLGGSFDHNYSWWDPTGICGDEPCDNAEHGTHTMGTMVGGDGPGPFTPDIGVAPGATWIAAKGCEDFFCSESSLLSSGEFVLAPTDLNGDDPDPSKRPDIVNNSWGGGPGDPFYAEVVQAWRAAGIIPVFSAGNAGPDCDSGGSPGDFLESFSAGATDENDEIADFSSRGPSTYGKVNPDVSAPGVDVVSSVPGDGYDAFSGTSMAAPHTSGTLALVLSAELGLLGDVDGATDAVRSTALDLLDDSCGGDEDGDPNNVFGDGRIDAQAAVTLVATGGTLAGDVSDVVTTDPIEGARIEATNGGRTFATTTDEAGHFEVFLGAGSYTVTASAFAYQSALATGVEIETDVTTTQDFFLAPLPQRDITGTVTAEEDGTPIEGAEVRALGTPVAPAITDADGEYTLTLPIGDHTIRIAAGGCTSSSIADVTLGLGGLVHDAALSRKLDDFGHGCRGIAFDWVDAAFPTALFGDQTTGRLPLPFSFPFYGEDYDVVYVTDNGYVTFEAPEFGFPDPTPVSIPSVSTPNTAIYPLWQNLVIDDDSSIRFETVGSSPDRAFVIEYEQMKVGPRFGDLGANAEPAVTGRIDVEVKLWEDGRIDLLYGDNPANPGDGRDAGIGIENADGTDALQFSFSDDLLGTNVAYRYELVPTGTVTGTVTDANDGLPIGGAAVTAEPGGRSASSAADGTYSIRLRPGTYDVSITADGYVTHEETDVVVTDGGSTVIDAALLAPVAGVEPTELDASVDFGDSSTSPITISNTGSSDLTWELREREGSRVPPDLPPVPLVIRKPVWGRMEVPASVRAVRPAALPPAALITVIDDPDDDSLGSVEVTEVRGGSDNAELSIAIDFDADTPMDEPGGFFFFDTDQDPSTGFAPEEFFGLPEQDIGVDYFADLFGIHDSEPVVFIVSADFELVAEVPAVIDGQSVSFSVPLEAFGDDDGNADVASVIGDFNAPLDWAPDEGHGTVQTFTDAPWMGADPTEGVVPPGETAEVEVTLGGADVAPGEYTGSLFLLSDAPKQPALQVDVTLSVGLPEGWGEATGTVLDAHTFEPISGATITVETTWDGDPLVLTDTSDGDGLWSVLGPPGTWPAEVTGEGYLDETTEVTIVADGSLEGQDVFLHGDQPHGTIRPGSLRFTLLRGRQDEQVLRLGNVKGHRDLTFEVGEVAIPPPGDDDGGEEPPEPLSIPQSADPNATDSRSTGHTSPGHAGVGFEGEVIAEWDTEMSLPWGVGYRNGPDTVTLTDPEDLIDVEFTPAGDRTGEFDTPWVGDWAGDLAWDAGRGLLWHVNVGGDNAIYGVDPADGSVVETVSGPGWTDVSQRGLAYDQATDTFYIGGWNEGIVYHVAGPSWPEPGETLDSCSPEDPNISGLAWNPAFHKLWVATNSDFDDIWLIDPDTCEPENVLFHPDPGFNGAGLELDAVGNLWTVSQGSQKAYLIESGLPTFSDVPWLDVTPTEGVVEPGEKATISVSVDSTGLSPGTYQAFVGVVTDDPDLGVATVRVRLLVTKYQKFVNVGGGAVTFPDGTGYVGDRRFVEGRFGWAGESSVRTTGHPIAGTLYPSVFRSQREGMSSYRFSVPNGRYRVKLEFAELAGLTEFGRIMDISSEGQLRFNNLDVAGRVGRWRALTVSFEAQVRDGLLMVRFERALGAPPMLNGIRVTWLGA
jgi:subtilisin family serine protease